MCISVYVHVCTILFWHALLYLFLCRIISRQYISWFLSDRTRSRQCSRDLDLFRIVLSALVFYTPIILVWTFLHRDIILRWSKNKLCFVSVTFVNIS